MKSNILFVKDLFDNQGVFKDIENFTNTLKCKKNWLCEYLRLKSVFKKFETYFDLGNCENLCVNIYDKKFCLKRKI